MARSETSDVGLGHLITGEVDLLVYFIDWPRQKDVARVWWPTLEGLIRLNARITQPVVIASVLPDGFACAVPSHFADGNHHLPSAVPGAAIFGVEAVSAGAGVGEGGIDVTVAIDAQITAAPLPGKLARVQMRIAARNRARMRGIGAKVIPRI